MFDYINTSVITPEILIVLKYAKIDNKDLYLHILDKFNSEKLIIKGNLNDTDEYKGFIIHFLEGLMYNKYMYSDLVWRYKGNPDFFNKQILDYFSSCNYEIKHLIKLTNSNCLRKEYEIIKTFLNKNAKLICEPKMKSNYQRTSGRIIDRALEKVKNYEKYRNDIKQLQDVLEKDYSKGKISAIDYGNIISKLQE